jgi:hypothetical protein
MVSSRASLEASVALERERTVTRNRESICRAGTLVTLELGCWRSQNAAATVTIGETTFGIDTILCTSKTCERQSAKKLINNWISNTLSNTVLAVRKLTYDSTRATRGSQMEAATICRVREYQKKYTFLTHHVESRAMSASAAATRAAETKMDFMAVVLVSREEVVYVVGQLVVEEMMRERMQNQAVGMGYIYARGICDGSKIDIHEFDLPSDRKMRSTRRGSLFALGM